MAWRWLPHQNVGDLCVFAFEKIGVECRLQWRRGYTTIVALIAACFNGEGHGEVLGVESGCRGVQVELRAELDLHGTTADLRAGLNDHGHGVQAELKGLMDTTDMRDMMGNTGTMGSTSNCLDTSSWYNTPELFG